MEKYGSYIKKLKEKKENNVVYTKYPEELRSYIYTTNWAESVNSMIDRYREKKGGYFGSVEQLEIGIYLQRERLKNTKWKNGVPRIKNLRYEINQMFQLRYYGGND